MSIVRSEVMRRDNYRCRGCSRTFSEVHHIVFRSHGGPDLASNLICLCSECHDRAHGVQQPSIERWELQALTHFPGDVLQLRARPPKLCVACFFYHDTACGLWDCLVQPDASCDSWRNPY
jgi:hypothetical protein